MIDWGASLIEEMRAEVFAKTKFRCSAGIAHCKTLAKVNLIHLILYIIIFLKMLGFYWNYWFILYLIDVFNWFVEPLIDC